MQSGHWQKETRHKEKKKIVASVTATKNEWHSSSWTHFCLKKTMAFCQSHCYNCFVAAQLKFLIRVNIFLCLQTTSFVISSPQDDWDVMRKWLRVYFIYSKCPMPFHVTSNSSPPSQCPASETCHPYQSAIDSLSSLALYALRICFAMTPSEREGEKKTNKRKKKQKTESRILDKQIKNAAIKANTSLYYNNMTKNISEKLLWILVY